MSVTTSTNLGYPIPGAATGDSQLLDIQAVKSALISIDTNLDTALNSGGGTSDVTYTLTTLPGHGIVPTIFVADYIELDAAADGWIEVAAGDTGVELFEKQYGTLYGPIGAWAKNPRYVIGSNGENRLIVKCDVSAMSSANQSSKFTAPTSDQTSSSDDPYSVLRAAKCLPLYPNVTAMAEGDSFTVINMNSNEQWVAVMNAQVHRGIARNSMRDAISAPDNSFANSIIPIYGNSSRGRFEKAFVNDELVLVLDDSSYTGFAGLPARYASNSTNYRQYLATKANSSTGVLEWDYMTNNLEKLANYNKDITPSNKEVLTFNSNLSKWEPKRLNINRSLSVDTALGGLIACDSDDFDIVKVTDQVGAVDLHIPYGSPIDGQTLRYIMRGDGSTIGFHAVFVDRGATKPAILAAGKWTRITCEWNATTNTWDVISVIVEA